MGIKSTFQNAAANALSAFGDIPQAATLFKAASDQPSYNPATSSPATAGTSYSITKVIYDKYSDKDIDGEKVKLTDEIALIPNAYITATPEVDDILTKEDSSEWTIIRIVVDPAEALYSCQIRPN